MVNLENYEEYMLLYADNELNKEEEQALLAFVQQHPELQKELDAYMGTRLQPDNTIVFENKEALMKQAPGGRTMWLGSWKAYAAAASIILFAVLFFINRDDKVIEEAQIVKNEPVQETPITDIDTVQPIQQEKIINKLQSKQPVNTIAVKQSPKQEQQSKSAPVTPKPEQVQQPAPVEEVIAEVPKKQPEQAPVIVKQTEPEKTIITPQPEAVIEKPEAPAHEKQKKTSFIASVVNDKADGLSGLGDAFNEKLMAAKAVRNTVKDTDVTFKIGRKEIFTVRL